MPSHPPLLRSLSKVLNSFAGSKKCSAVSVQVMKSYFFKKMLSFGKKYGSYNSTSNQSLVKISAKAGPCPHPKSRPLELGNNFSIRGLESLDKKFL